MHKRDHQESTKKIDQESKDGMRANTLYNYNNSRDRVGIGDADAGGYKAGTLKHEEEQQT